jgi:hypothetical protein
MVTPLAVTAMALWMPSAASSSARARRNMDALQVTPAEVAALSTTTASAKDDDVSGLPEKVAAVARVAEDMRARRREPAGV